MKVSLICRTWITGGRENEMQLMFFDGRTHNVQEMLVATNVINVLKTAGKM